ncbi:MAG: ribosomal protein S18-alanine N-acetyltransferase [Actinomycetota bacterium]|nr:ribosomal protein S18-alanine N-acetyltransferase [Actinomycetota bacterium]
MAEKRLVRIRDMKERDLGQVHDIEVQTFPTPWTRSYFAMELGRRRSICLVAVRGGEVIGYLMSRFFGREVHLTNIVVSREERRGGIGSRLMGEFMRRCVERGVRYITLEVRGGNLEAQAFYRRFGFRDIGIRRGYYTDSGEDALIMSTPDLQLSPFVSRLGISNRGFSR